MPPPLPVGASRYREPALPRYREVTRCQDAVRGAAWLSIRSQQVLDRRGDAGVRSTWAEAPPTSPSREVRAMPTTLTPVVFIHGLWLHATSWGPWMELFRENGYEPVAPGWPNEPRTVAAARAQPELVAGIG